LNRATLSGGLLWKPFHLRFATLIERLEKHQQWFETEASIQQHEIITHHYESFQAYLKETEKKSEKDAYKESAEQQAWYREHYVTL
jgi:hypothetical protein